MSKILGKQPEDNLDFKPILKFHKKKRLKKANNVGAETFSSAKKLQRKKHFWQRRVFSFAMVVVLGVSSGVWLGGWYKDYISGQSVDYSNYNLEDYEINRINVLNSVTGQKFSSENEIGDIVAILKSNGKLNPCKLSASQNFAIADFLASKATSYQAVGVGVVDTIANQDITSSKKFDGSTYTFESMSAGMLTVATCAVMQKGGSNVQLYKGDGLQQDETTKIHTAVWKKDKSLPLTEYEQLNGMQPDRLLPYVVSSKTIIDEANVQVVETTFNDKKAYEFTMQLDPVTSVLRYYRQVMQTSGLESAPKFYDVQVKVILDENWNFVRTEVLEHYTVVAFGIPAECTGTLNTDFVFNQNVTLPVGGAA